MLMIPKSQSQRKTCMGSIEVMSSVRDSRLEVE